MCVMCVGRKKPNQLFGFALISTLGIFCCSVSGNSIHDLPYVTYFTGIGSMKLSTRCHLKNPDGYGQKYHELCGRKFVTLTIIVVYLLGVQTSMNIIYIKLYVRNIMSK